MNKKIELNKPVPNFKFTATNHVDSDLAAQKGRVIVLYFYPKDNTPGCTSESKDFRDYFNDFYAANTTIFGISRDSLTSHEKFKLKYNLPYELISDQDEQLCQLFDVLKMKSLFGKQYQGLVRSTFVLDSEGKLLREWREVKVSGHAKEVLDYVKSLKK